MESQPDTCAAWWTFLADESWPAVSNSARWPDCVAPRSDRGEPTARVHDQIRPGDSSQPPLAFSQHMPITKNVAGICTTGIRIPPKRVSWLPHVHIQGRRMPCELLNSWRRHSFTRPAAPGDRTDVRCTSYPTGGRETAPVGIAMLPYLETLHV